MIDIRSLQEHSEMVTAVALQRKVWGFADADLLPVRMFVIARKIGGQVLGAFDDTRMVGFCIAIPGRKPTGESYLHSHMLGVDDEYRNQGIGRMLKLAQREEALARGVTLIEWTFDPLEMKNAYLNIERLGAVVRRYVRNQYGFSTSPLHAGMPTDRCIAEWHIASEKSEHEIVAEIEVPPTILTLRKEDPTKALEIQNEISDQFLHHFREGLAVVGVRRNGDGGTYLLSKWQSE
jgi:predicted GNAT superfamily acetyltransferase